MTAISLACASAAAEAAKPVSTRAQASFVLEDASEITLLARKRSVANADVQSRLTQDILSLVATVATLELDSQGVPQATYLVGESKTSYEVGIPVVSPPSKLPKGLFAKRLRGGKLATSVFVGKHSDLRAARSAFVAAVLAKHRLIGEVWESYLTNPMTETDPTKQKTKLSVLVADK